MEIAAPSVRARVWLAVRSNPGVHFRGLQRQLGLAPGQAMHHLRSLVAEGAVAERRSGRYLHYYPVGAPLETRPAQAALQQGARRATALALRDAPRTLRQLSQQTGYAESTLHHHLRVLLSAGALRVEGTRPASYTLTTEAREALAVHEGPSPAASPPPAARAEAVASTA